MRQRTCGATGAGSRWAVVVVVALTALLLGAPMVVGHGGGHDLDEELVEGGENLLVGSFAAPQPGPLVVVPYTEGPLGCDQDLEGEYRVPLGDGVGVMLASNATRVQLLADLPPNATGYAGFAVDTHDATRALLEMQEHAVSLHALVGVVRTEDANGTAHEAATGALGVPYPLAEADAHGHGVGAGRTLFMDHDGSFGAPLWCSDQAGGHLRLAFERADLPLSLTPGRLVHAVALVDMRFAQFLPRAIEDSTKVFEANLYLARAGEDPERVRAALDPTPSAQDVVPVALLALGVVWVAGRVRDR